MPSDAVWTLERLIRYPAALETDVSPDGSRVVYTVREPVLTDEASKFVTHLYLTDARGGAPLRLTYGQTRNAMPRWSPDGRYIAFLSDRANGVRNLHVLCAAGGEAWPVTACDRDVVRFAWSPDGTRLAFVMVPPESEERKAARKAGDDTIRWGIDYERAHLWVVHLVTGGAPPATPQNLTPADDRHVGSIAWVGAGRHQPLGIAYTYQPTPSPDVWCETRLAILSLGEQPETRDLARVASWNPEIAACGDWVACPTAAEPVRWTVKERVIAYPVTGGAPKALAPTPDERPYILGWSADGQQVLVLESSGISSAIYALPLDGGAPTTLCEGEGYVTAVRTNGRDALSLVHEDVDCPNRVCLWPPGERSWREIASPLGADWPLEATPRTEVIRWQAPDGTEVEGLITLPVGYTAGQRYLTIVMVHGGPMSLYTRTYVATANMYPIAAFAERGYVVLRANPRGSGGYGAAFRAANVRDWGGGDFADIMAGVDDLIARGIADADRLGIMGWSYGGFMTSWAITQTTRFRAASVGAGVTNLMSFTGTTDIPSFVADYFAAEFWDDPEAYATHSALFNVRGVSTPTLIQHGEADERVPLSQSKELYNALKRQGVPVEMDIYPRQGHGPSEPRIIMDIMRRNLEWFDRWVKA
jgi:dipeptidyl aminopeptidase/acylaminoacyl peptidase